MKKYIVGGLLIIGFGYGYFFIIRPTLVARNEFLEKEYKGKINKIEYRTGYRGFPHVMLDEKWYFLGQDEGKILHFIRINDSIVKRKGTNEIVVFTRDGSGQYISKTF
jgi:hypothetical protein